MIHVISNDKTGFDTFRKVPNFENILKNRAPDKVSNSISVMPISSPYPMFDHLLEPSHRDDSSKLSHIGFGEEIMQVVSIEVNFKYLIRSHVKVRQLLHSP